MLQAKAPIATGRSYSAALTGSLDINDIKQCKEPPPPPYNMSDDTFTCISTCPAPNNSLKIFGNGIQMQLSDPNAASLKWGDWTANWQNQHGQQWLSMSWTFMNYKQPLTNYSAIQETASVRSWPLSLNLNLRFQVDNLIKTDIDKNCNSFWATFSQITPGVQWAPPKLAVTLFESPGFKEAGQPTVTNYNDLVPINWAFQAKLSPKVQFNTGDPGPPTQTLIIDTALSFRPIFAPTVTTTPAPEPVEPDAPYPGPPCMLYFQWQQTCHKAYEAYLTTHIVPVCIFACAQPQPLRLRVVRYSCCINDDGPNINDDGDSMRKSVRVNGSDPPVRFTEKRETEFGAEQIPIGTIFGGDTEMDVLLSAEAAETANTFLHQFGVIPTTTTTTLPHACPAVSIMSIDNPISKKYAQVKNGHNDAGQCQATGDVGAWQTWFMIKVNDETCATKIVDGDIVGLKNKQSDKFLSHQSGPAAGPAADIDSLSNEEAQWAVRCSCDTCSDCDSVQLVRDAVSWKHDRDSVTCVKLGCLECGPIQLKTSDVPQNHWKITPV
eukprot:TRINITY_DN72952_c0_g1_i1.p1 TRINITY_DN72952_c0_g1~~TRINITY_DN72952_c0_g1_i1.p1  ORF type:complete len:550 (-),score=39.63 TRINITY_DN72952_c0_g1_i1:100-1749(-)